MNILKKIAICALAVGTITIASTAKINARVVLPTDLEPSEEDKSIPYDDEVFHNNLLTYGFEVGNYWKAYSYNDEENDLFSHEKEYKERKVLNHYTTLHDALLQSKTNPNHFAYIYKITVNPKQVRNWGFFGINSYGDNWYFNSLVSECNLPNGSQILNYSPTNVASSWSESVDLGISGGYGELSANISCGVSYPVSELEVTSESDYISHYYTEYSAYDLTKFTKNSSCYFGMFTFKCNGTPKIEVTHNVQYFGEFYKFAAHGKVNFVSEL